jgi:hypothetical protein
MRHAQHHWLGRQCSAAKLAQRGQQTALDRFLKHANNSLVEG